MLCNKRFCKRGSVIKGSLRDTLQYTMVSGAGVLKKDATLAPKSDSSTYEVESSSAKIDVEVHLGAGLNT